MIGVTLFGLLFTPSFYVITKMLGERTIEWSRRMRRNRRRPGDPIAEGEPA